MVRDDFGFEPVVVEEMDSQGLLEAVHHLLDDEVAVVGKQHRKGKHHSVHLQRNCYGCADVVEEYRQAVVGSADSPIRFAAAERQSWVVLPVDVLSMIVEHSH